MAVSRPLVIRSVELMSACFCTLAVGDSYRKCARALCTNATCRPWIVLTDQPDDFADLPVRAFPHQLIGPTAADYVARLGPAGVDRGAAAAYHDKRFALQATLQEHDTAVFVDADSTIDPLPHIDAFPPGLAVLPLLGNSIAAHLQVWGSWRVPAFTELARALAGNEQILRSTLWCHEAFYAVTKDGNESQFFRAWEYAADFLKRRGINSGEGGVMGLAAICAGWTVNDAALAPLLPLIHHQGGGPKPAAESSVHATEPPIASDNL